MVNVAAENEVGRELFNPLANGGIPGIDSPGPGDR